MARPGLIRSKSHPYHVSSRVLNGEFFPMPLDELWPLMLNELNRAHKNHGLAIHAFVLMGNHFHLLCHTPRENLDQIMQSFLRNTSVLIARRSKASHHWGGRYKWSLIQSHRHYFQVYRYIYQNPLRAKIANRVEEYPFSSLKAVPFPLHSFIPLSFAGEEGELLWLNERYDIDEVNLIKLGLRRYQFDVGQRNLKSFNKLKSP